MKPSVVQPALIGGLVIGVLSVLPIIDLGNWCCCLWIISGGVVAIYLLQQAQSAPVTAADGALVGLLAGLVGAFVYGLLSIPLDLYTAPMRRQMLERVISQMDVPPAFRDLARRVSTGPVVILLGFVRMLFLGVIFSTLGGVLGAAIFGKKTPPAVIDVPPVAPP
jgi:hypothetical protein